MPVCPPERPRSGVSIPKIDFVHHALCTGNERRMRPCRATRAGTQAPPLPNSIIFFHTIPHKQNNHLRTIHPNDTNHPHAIHPNDINRSTRNLLKRNRRGGHTGTPLPISIIFFHAIPYKQNNHLRAIFPSDTNRSTRNLPKCHSTFTRNLPKRN